ncbi:hypothetical protein EVJ22_11475 [Exiguobacterium sp. SH0S7]|uniref:hypothetical protein n=2 Tax=unclassified Exiguobacterium TaxID=2644629 RepID=UPI00104081DE|nr:hypothetical protein [Exiguobacterium sp. SH0S7]TCI69084.1 hypothetical protein EVJ22_11475 [Exiguobacterium sp. SH0S7]
MIRYYNTEEERFIETTFENKILVYVSAFRTHHDRTEAKTFLPGGVLVQSGGNSLTLNSELLEQFVGFSI